MCAKHVFGVNLAGIEEIVVDETFDSICDKIRSEIVRGFEITVLAVRWTTRAPLINAAQETHTRPSIRRLHVFTEHA